MRVVIAEDLALLRDGLARLLRDNGFDVVAAVDNPDALVHEVLLEKADIAIVDVRLPPTFRDEGLRAALELRRGAPDTAILVVSQYVEHDVRRRAARRRPRRCRLPAEGPDHRRRRASSTPCAAWPRAARRSIPRSSRSSSPGAATAARSTGSPSASSRCSA